MSTLLQKIVNGTIRGGDERITIQKRKRERSKEEQKQEQDIMMFVKLVQKKTEEIG